MTFLAGNNSRVIPRPSPPACRKSSVSALLASLSTGNFTGVNGIAPAITSTVREATWDAYSISYRTVFLCTLPFGVILLIASVLAPNVEDYLTDEVARRLHMPNEEKMDVRHKDLMMMEEGASEVNAHAATREVV